METDDPSRASGVFPSFFTTRDVTYSGGSRTVELALSPSLIGHW